MVALTPSKNCIKQGEFAAEILPAALFFLDIIVREKYKSGYPNLLINYVIVKSYCKE